MPLVETVEEDEQVGRIVDSKKAEWQKWEEGILNTEDMGMKKFLGSCQEQKIE
jgi:hypothetical protein